MPTGAFESLTITMPPGYGDSTRIDAGATLGSIVGALASASGPAAEDVTGDEAGTALDFGVSHATATGMTRQTQAINLMTKVRGSALDDLKIPILRRRPPRGEYLWSLATTV